MKGAAAAAAATAALLRSWAHESTFPLSSLLPSTDDAEFGCNTDAHPSYNIILARTDHGLGGTLALSHTHILHCLLCSVYSPPGQQRPREAAAPLPPFPFSVKREFGPQLMTDG
ncbi:hypothetical protein BDP81DRAFT_128315 [Colletotrichum phormii]|uniref:Uncharacterized protein n=1 Tax=Colletotrichum phormii TaxID=359342 RepID=A0AAJ0A2A3_9PEZI|nr:uncharacterized protein BDP81DRAFT_128315 [Colletotrichum phormii]KAK1641144.1 hypothetical protein BDP81DRAFT_128315 [Colletotrichum phormii]